MGITKRMDPICWAEVKKLLDALYASSERLEALFPGRKFTLDGHLVGSIGEVIAAYMCGLKLSRASTLGHDAIAPDGRRVEIKFTQGAKVALRHEPEHLIILQRPSGGPVKVIYNGPGSPAWDAAGTIASNGQRPITLSKLKLLDNKFNSRDRLTILRPAPV